MKGQVALVSLLAALAGCSGRPALENRPGDSLLDQLSEATLLEYPGSNLPAGLSSRLSSPFQMTSVVPQEVWRQEGVVPAAYRKRLQGAKGLRYWRARTSLPLAPSSATPVTLLDGQISRWSEGTAFPGLYAWYEPAAQSVFALSAPKPRDIRLQFTADPRAAVGEYEPSLAGMVAPYEPVDLMRRVEMRSVSRPALLLSAPAALSLPEAKLAADELELAVGVIDRSYRLDDGNVESTAGGSDGVEFQVEVKSGARSTTVWTRTVERADLGRWIEAKVDLRPYRDQKVTLVLRTSPGPNGDNAFDYALWSGLRFRGAARSVPDRPHVVLIYIDALRPDRMSTYGHQRPTTPRIDRWIQQRGVVYRDALASSSWTLPSTASMLTGLAPHQHLVHSADTGLAATTTALATYLRAAGYETYSSVDNVFFRSGFGFDQGFDVNDARGGVSHWMKLQERIRSRSTERPIFLFLHTLMVHAPYQYDSRFLDAPSESGRSQFEGEGVTYDNCIHPYKNGELELSDADKRYINALYDAGVARMDEAAGRFLEELETALEGQAALVFFTADHGEEFWEHNRMGHGNSLHHEVLRVPLLVRFPEPRVNRVSRDPVGLLDLVPTVLDYAGLEAPRTLPGQSLREPIPSPRLRVAQLDDRHFALQLGAWKLIRGASVQPRWKPDPVELFHLADDAAELHNLAGSMPDRVTELDQHWAEYLKRYPVTLDEPEPAAGVGPEEVKSLRTLGYVR